jgi:hypothetical protein
MNRRGLKALARELLAALRPEVAEHLKWQCGAYMRDVCKSSILAEWAGVCESNMDKGRDDFEIGMFYSKTRNPVLVTMSPEWFDTVIYRDYCAFVPDTVDCRTCRLANGAVDCAGNPITDGDKPSTTAGNGDE